ncbi:DTW domain-containing protein [Microbulbifer sp. OS29]|uniref:tRNA-uridine aminocarboxypropyltransferase n=1 Tax=Microbulbifer okhotskensis TaxID=2926617 RepID=A0A9X2EV88_9GAMM|nr:tRNA-uridine aminocarboxypropyltransferase [Microbulbifer okhotskensis]MCO1336576.1 DTW domain-containing protein [Microbulbifer okhotskensis]
MPRETCNTCLRPPNVCYCSSLVNLANSLKVVIIQHPQEVKHPFNTGRMAHLCLNNSEMMTAETLAGDQLNSLLNIPSALLYPSLEWLPDSIEFNSGLSSESNQPPNIQQLIVIDATWKKSKKILHLNPPLQKLPRVNFNGGLESRYSIRKTSIADGLSTIESIAKAMVLLEKNSDFFRLLKPFERMISLQQQSYTTESLL